VLITLAQTLASTSRELWVQPHPEELLIKYLFLTHALLYLRVHQNKGTFTYNCILIFIYGIHKTHKKYLRPHRDFTALSQTHCVAALQQETGVERGREETTDGMKGRGLVSIETGSSATADGTRDAMCP